MTAQAMAKGPGGAPSPAGGAACYWKEMWKKLNMMRQLWQLCDIEIISNDEQMFMAHSPVLAASSEVFHAFLVNKDTSIITEKAESKLYLSKVPGDILQVTLDFIYGNMPMTLEAFEKLEKGAALLGIKGAMSFVGHKGFATKPGSKCPMAQWKTNTSKDTSDLDDLFNIDHVLFSIPSTTDDMFSPPVVSDDVNEPTSQPSEPQGALLSAVTKEALDVVIKYEDSSCSRVDAADTTDTASPKPSTSTSTATSSTPSTSATNAGNAANDKEDEEEPRCPFAISLGIHTKGMENPHINGNDLLTEISLADTYPETVTARVPPPKKDKQRMAEVLENEFAKASGVVGELNDLESMDESEFVPLIATKRKRSRSKKGSFSKSMKLAQDENSNEIVDDKDESSDGGLEEWHDETSQQSDATSGQDESQDSKMIKQALEKVTVDTEAEENNKKLLQQLEAIDEDRMYTCIAEGCNYKNKMLDYLQSHMFHRHNLGQPDKKCPNCFHAYFSYRQLKTHLRRTHFKADDKTDAGHYCGECGLLFKQITSMKLHQLKVHGKGKVFSCEDCEFKSPRKKDMQYHMLSRHNKKPPGVRIFECVYCNYKCVDKSRHEEHQAKHTAEQKFSCELCGKAYTTKRGMRTHLKYHSDARPHQCPYCPASFKMKNKLNAHIKLLHTHNEVRPFQCGYCSHVTKSRGNCNQHIRKHHKGQPVFVIDHLASMRRPGPGYHYTNIKGQGVIETKDLSMAKWATVGHSENRGYVRNKPAPKKDVAEGNVGDNTRYDSDSSTADNTAAYVETCNEVNNGKSVEAGITSEKRWVDNDHRDNFNVKIEGTMPNAYDNEPYGNMQENPAHSHFYNQECPTPGTYEQNQSYAAHPGGNVGQTGLPGSSNHGFMSDCQVGATPGPIHGGNIYTNPCSGYSDSLNSGVGHGTYDYPSFCPALPVPGQNAPPINREAIFL